LSQKEGKERNETVNELARRIESGEARITRLGEEMERGRRTHAHVVGSLFGGSQFIRPASRSNEEVGENLQSGTVQTDRPTSEEEAYLLVKNNVLSWARENGYYIDEDDVKNNSFDGKMLDEGAESRIYRSKDGSKVTKFSLVSSFYKESLLPASFVKAFRVSSIPRVNLEKKCRH
jgi:hypothetical protein